MNANRTTTQKFHQAIGLSKSDAIVLLKALPKERIHLLQNPQIKPAARKLILQQMRTSGLLVSVESTRKQFAGKDHQNRLSERRVYNIHRLLSPMRRLLVKLVQELYRRDASKALATVEGADLKVRSHGNCSKKNKRCKSK